MVDCFPEYEWYEWFFGHAPRGFWSVPDNRQRYMQWLGRQLGFHRPRDWYGIRQDDFEAHRGSTLLHCYSSMYDFMQEFLPQLDWEPFKYGPPLSIEQILQLADNHFNQYGSWPHSHSGPVNGTNLTWSAISERLRLGFRGTHPGHSLSALLEQYRNVRPGRTPPPLSEKQILAWADAYFALHGRWPTEDSGTIAGTQETWGKITAPCEKALAVYTVDRRWRNCWPNIAKSATARISDLCQSERSSNGLALTNPTPATGQHARAAKFRIAVGKRGPGSNTPCFSDGVDFRAGRVCIGF